MLIDKGLLKLSVSPENLQSYGTLKFNMPSADLR